MSDKSIDAELEEALAASEDVEESTVQPEGEAPEAEAAGSEEAAEPVEIPEELQPVSAWKEEARQAWESIASNAEYHDYLRNLRGQLDSDYQYRTQLEQQRAELEPMAQAAQHFQQMTQQYQDVFQGQDPMSVVGNLLYYSQQLNKNPQETIQQLAKSYGVDLNEMLQDQPYVDEYTQKLESELNAVRQQVHNWQAQQQQAQTGQVVQSAKAFEFETDAEGNLLHPHVSKVADHMIGLVRSGQASDWKSAYETACWMNPEVRDILLKEQGQSKELQRKEQAEKAKAAASASQKRGKSSKGQPAGVEDLDDALDKGFAEAAA